MGTGVAVVATAHCTTVATFTEFKPELRNFPFAKRQLFALQRADPAAAPHQPTKTYLLKLIPSMFSGGNLTYPLSS
jgi:hypothetical protein